MKLNYKRTILVGFAFFLISAFWQAYDTIIPLMLTNKFGLNQFWSGVIMSLDNILALFMLPLFGALSDKKDTRFGKRTPFIVAGAIAAIICFMSLTFVDAAQLKKIEVANAETFWTMTEVRDGQEELILVENREYNGITNNSVTPQYTVRDYAAKIYYNKTYDQLSAEEKTSLENWYKGELNENTVYVYVKPHKDADGNVVGESYRLCYTKEVDGKDKLFYVDTNEAVGSDVLTTNAFSSLVSEARSQFAAGVTKGNLWVLAIFIIVLLMVLISMATFRSPAVALMPDVTIKPLRSKGNAVINLMGTAGGLLVLVLGMLFGTGKVVNQIMNYTWFVAAVCGIMLVALIVFMFTVKEKRWNAEMLEAQAVLDAEEEEKEKEKENAAKSDTAAEATDSQTTATTAEVTAPKKDRLPKDKLISLILILASVALWFTGYNAITSKYSVYAVNVLNKDYNTTLMIAQGAAIISYIPVGFLASKIGRKKSILIGIGLLTGAFAGAIFITASSPAWLLWILFALAGIGWATINVNSFPMVVELAKGSTIGKYTGYYYTASMAAQVITPILSGALMDAMGTMSILFPYGAIFAAASFVTMLFVKHGDSKPETAKDKMEMLAGADD
ncbi:MAG: MFS transporter [Clostridiales bacterium]|nr:MFS transporter [Clostridiales bacterium]